MATGTAEAVGCTGVCVRTEVRRRAARVLATAPGRCRCEMLPLSPCRRQTGVELAAAAVIAGAESCHGSAGDESCCSAAHHALRTCQSVLSCSTCLSSSACICGFPAQSSASHRPLLVYASACRSGIHVRNAAFMSCRPGRVCRSGIWARSSGRLGAGARVRAPARVAAGPLLRIRVVRALPLRPAWRSSGRRLSQGSASAAAAEAAPPATASGLLRSPWCVSVIRAPAGPIGRLPANAHRGKMQWLAEISMRLRWGRRISARPLLPLLSSAPLLWTAHVGLA